MNDFELKNLISKLTGVQLIRQGMADVANVPPIAERGLQWRSYQLGQSTNIPKAMQAELDRLYSSFASRFAESGGQPNQGQQMVYAFYASDPILNDQQRQIVSANPTFVELLDFMEDHGLRLWNSPAAMHNWAQENRKPYNPLGVNGGVGPDGRDKYFETFGYAWGARKQAVNRNMRVVKPLSPEKAQHILGEQQGVDAATQDQRVVQLVTAQRNGAWGIFLQDSSGKNYSVIGDNYYARTKTTQDDSGFADPGEFAATKGQHHKFFGYNDTEQVRGIMPVLPTQTQFILQSPDDPQPKPARRGNLGETPRSERYYLWIKHDGTLWWLKSAERGAHISGQQSKLLPLTQEQVDFFNIHKGHFWQMSNPDVEVYDWNTVPEDTRPQEQQDYRQKTNLMNQMVDTLLSQGQAPKVHLNAFKYAIVGPFGQSGENIESQKTPGQFPYPTTVDTEPGHDKGAFTVMRRRDWVRMSNEFNEERAAKTGQKGYIPQNMTGRGAQSAEQTLREALVKAFRDWNINAPFPPDEQINAAQMLFDKIHYPELTGQQSQEENAAPQVSPDMTNELMGNPSPEPNVTPAQPQLQQQAIQPPTPSAPVVPGKVKVWYNGKFQNAKTKPAFVKSSSDVIKKLRGLR